MLDSKLAPTQQEYKSSNIEVCVPIFVRLYLRSWFCLHVLTVFKPTCGKSAKSWVTRLRQQHFGRWICSISKLIATIKWNWTISLVEHRKKQFSLNIEYTASMVFVLLIGGLRAYIKSIAVHYSILPKRESKVGSKYGTCLFDSILCSVTTAPQAI